MKETALPAWMTKGDEYSPRGDRDAFIDKSILSVLGVLSRIRMQGVRRDGKFRAHALFKLAFTLLLVVLLSLSKSLSFIFVAAVGVLCRLCLLRAEEIVRVLRNALAAVAFTALVLLPAGILGNWYSLEAITPKVFVTVSALSLLSYGTRWNELTGALKYFLIPDIFIFVLDIAIKYILLLGEFTLNMLYALKLRSVGKNPGKQASLSGIAGTLFLRSRDMAVEMHSAMECRGFSGEYRRPARFGFNLYDALLIFAAAALSALFAFLRQ